METGLTVGRKRVTPRTRKIEGGRGLYLSREKKGGCDKLQSTGCYTHCSCSGTAEYILLEWRHLHRGTGITLPLIS